MKHRLLYTILLLVITAFFFPSCGASDDYAVPVTLWQPQKKSDVISYFKNGNPLGAVKGVDCDLLINLEPVNLFDRTYMRLWLLYKNYGENEFLIEPLNNLTLTIVTKDNDSVKIHPMSPTLLLQRIENKKIQSEILQTIGGVLQAVTTAPTSVTGSDGTTYSYNDQKDKIKNVIQETRQDIFNTDSWYTVFSNTINSGILRKNTLFTGDGVNGNVYFQIPYLESKEPTKKKKPKSNIDENRYSEYFDYEVDYDRCSYDLNIITQEGVKTIHFKPIKGE
ncbi:MAG: hypothetical protein M3R36_11335 [Bacteroidota bacterium]|nr:hypothetical protein [Bacteroidota bacterium]